MKYFKGFIFAILFANLIVTQTNASDVPETVPVSARLTALEAFPDPRDVAVFPLYQEWFEGDVKAIVASIRNAEHQEKVVAVAGLTKAAFESGRINYLYLRFAYKLMSTWLSVDTSERVPHIRNPFVGIGGIPSMQEEFDAMSAYMQDQNLKQYVDYIYRYDEYQVRIDSYPIVESELFAVTAMNANRFACLPYVAENAGVEFRDLNHSFAMGRSILGLPLQPGSFDGCADKSQCDYYTHDEGHLFFNLSGSIRAKYKIYEYMDGAVAKIADPRTRLICDIFLFFLGHERGFASRDGWGKRIGVNESSFDATCQSVDPITYGVSDCEERSVDSYFDSILPYLLGKAPPDVYGTGHHGLSEEEYNTLKERYYREQSKIQSLVNPETGNLFSRSGFFKFYNIPAGVQLSQSLFDKMGLNIKYLNEGADIVHLEVREMNRYWEFWALDYNLLTELCGYLNAVGIEASIWKDGRLDCSEFKALFESFKQVFIDNVKAPFYAAVKEGGLEE